MKRTLHVGATAARSIADMDLTPDRVNDFVSEVFPSAHEGGMTCEEIGDGYAIARWHLDSTQLRPGDYIPGPRIFGMADSALWFATFSVLGLEPMAVTSEMSIRFLRPAQGADLMARATVISVSTRRIVGNVELWIDGAPDRLVAVAQGTYSRPAE